MTFQLSFKADNDAFANGNRNGEIARILREVADRVEAGRYAGVIRDVNGNSVGSYGAYK